jgi:hypothetical protein
MAKSKESFDRRQRERAKKAKADAKRERRLSKNDAPDVEEPAPEAPRVDEDVLIGALGKLHEEFDDGKIGFDDFEARRTELLSRLQVD